jgi:hypothetical protein
MSGIDPSEIAMELARRRIDDSSARLRSQHEFSVEGFKTLVLINGGAIIGLLTFAGHSAAKQLASALSRAFMGYTVGLVVAVLAYLAAYLSQAWLMNMDMHVAYKMLGIEAQDKKSQDDYLRLGMGAVRVGIGLSIISLFGFVFGSWAAIAALG